MDLLPLLENDPDLEGVIPFNRHCWAFPRCWAEHIASIRRMRALAFDWVIDLQGLARSGFFAWTANGKFTIGVDDPREGARGFYDIAVRRPSFHTHAVEWYLEILRVLNVPTDRSFTWLPSRENIARNVQRKWNTAGSRWILLNPGARWETKRWPVEYYQKLIKLIVTHVSDVRIAILGSREDSGSGKLISQMMPHRCLDLTGQTSLPELIEWVRLGNLMISNDTGPMHIAAALDKPVVAIFGPTEPRRTGPYRQLDRVTRIPLPCSPCFKSECSNPKKLECLIDITPSAVFDEVRKRLSVISSIESASA